MSNNNLLRIIRTELNLLSREDEVHKQIIKEMLEKDTSLQTLTKVKSILNILLNR